jgi:hypothetical protein
MSVTDSRVKTGSLTLDGEAYSCQPTNVTIAPDHEGTEEDAVEVLCGDTVSGGSSQVLIANLTFTAIQDFTDPAGLEWFSWNNDGVETDFTWNPGSDPLDEWTGLVLPQALTVGGDVGQRITADAEWKLTKLITPPRFGSKTVIGSGDAATGATAGTPGSFTPSGASAPADLAALQAGSVTASPASAWTAGQYVDLGDASDAHWNGTAWATGIAP